VRLRVPLAGLVAALLALGFGAGSAHARQGCGRVVVFTLPGVMWSDVRDSAPDHLLAAARAGSVGSISVRTISSRTSYASGFATLGAGARVDAGRTTAGLVEPPEPRSGDLAEDQRVAAVEELEELAMTAGYGAVPGALGSALDGAPLGAVGNADPGLPPPVPAGLGRWTHLAAMDAAGRIDLAATGSGLLRRSPAASYGVRTDPGAIRAAVDAVLDRPCSVLVIDHGDLTRVDRASVGAPARSPTAVAQALGAADALLGHVRSALDPTRDLLLIVSPTSPWAAPEAHLGVAVAEGPGFPAGSALQSASTRRPGIVTLPDVAPTVLAHVDRSRPAAMNGRPWFAVGAPDGARARAAVDLDQESVFVDHYKSTVTTGFVAYQLLVYLIAVPLIARREAAPNATGFERLPVLAALAVVAFPVSTYLAGIVSAHEIGIGGLIALLVGFDLVLVAAASALQEPLDRLLALAAFTTAVLMVDLLLGARLQLNTVFGYSPIVAGRFAGTGNTAFAFMGAAGLISGALIVHRWPRSRWTLAATGALYGAVVYFDGAPQLGSDVGGILALVPALGVTWLLLAGRRPTIRTFAVAAVASVVALGGFLALDLARPPEDRTHLARLWEDIAERGGGVLVETVERKARSNLRVFRSTIYTFFVPPALGVMAWLLRRPRGRWQRLARLYPKLRAGLVGGLLLGVLGFAVNDSGIAIPAVILSYLLPMALLVHFVMARDHALDGSAAAPEGPA
jgi:hypothetical protein